jgi:hypothetical protein
MAEYTDLLKQYMGMLPKPEQLKSLLSPQQTQLQAGLLGAAKSLQPLMGYTTTPTTFGQAAVGALTGAAGGIQEKQQSDLARALQGLNVYSAIKDVTEKEKPLSTIGKLRYDYEKGDLTEEEFNNALTEFYGTKDTSLITNITRIAQIKNIPEAAAVDLLLGSKQKTKSDFVQENIANDKRTDVAYDSKTIAEKEAWLDERAVFYSDVYDRTKELDYGEKESDDQFTIGQTTVKDGITYEYKGNDQWEQVE